MEKIRLIVSSNDNGTDEEVYFSDDFVAPADDFLTPGLTLNSDTIIDDVLPSCFPRGYALRRRY